MLKIYLVRHGQDLDNERCLLNGRRDEPLTALGLAQADELAAFIKSHNLGLDKVYSSPLQRAYITAVKITEALNLPTPEVLPLLIERDFGIMSGQKKSDIEKLCAPKLLKTETINYFLEPDGGETFPELITRAKKLLKFISEKYKDGNVLLVGHGDFGKMIYAAYYNIPWEEALRMFHFGNSEILLLAPGVTPENTKIFKAPQFNN
jgi:broad specificity phosphatase PhoE